MAGSIAPPVSCSALRFACSACQLEECVFMRAGRAPFWVCPGLIYQMCAKSTVRACELVPRAAESQDTFDRTHSCRRAGSGFLQHTRIVRILPLCLLLPLRSQSQVPLTDRWPSAGLTLRSAADYVL